MCCLDLVCIDYFALVLKKAAFDMMFIQYICMHEQQQSLSLSLSL